MGSSPNFASNAKGPYNYEVHSKEGWVGLENSHTLSDSIVFKQ